MKRDDYLDDRHVRDFLQWAMQLVTGDMPLRHPRPDGDGEFESLLDAYRGYCWRKKTFDQTVEFLGARSRRIRHSMLQNDREEFQKAAYEVLRWGGVVASNQRRLDALHDEAIPLLQINARILDPATADLDRVGVVQPMNAGFSKIYSLILDHFPMYDSRVACALASLVRWFCEEEGYQGVPDSLAFGIPPNQGKEGKVNRDPSRGAFSFPKTQRSGAGLYARSNLMAAWILDELAKHGPFGKLGDDERQFALQSAMFMIGHKPLK